MDNSIITCSRPSSKPGVTIMIATEADLNQRYATEIARKNEYRALQAVLKEARASRLTAIKLAGKGITKQVLRMEFEAIRLRLANANALRIKARVTAPAVAAMAEAFNRVTATTYEAFKKKAIATFDRDREKLMPIWEMRDAFPEVNWVDFDDWMMEIQAEHLFYLQAGEARTATAEQKRKGIYNEFRGLLFFISRPECLSGKSGSTDHRPQPTSRPQLQPATDYESFKHKAIAAFDRFAQAEVMPIWEMRYAFPEVSRADFDDWMMSAQAENLFYLQQGEYFQRIASPEQKAAAIVNEFRGELFVVTRPSSRSPQKLT